MATDFTVEALKQKLQNSQYKLTYQRKVVL